LPRRRDSQPLSRMTVRPALRFRPASGHKGALAMGLALSAAMLVLLGTSSSSSSSSPALLSARIAAHAHSRGTSAFGIKTKGVRVLVSTRSPHTACSALAGGSMTVNGKKIIISGAPASGKGTQCQLIVEKYGVKHISTGDALRAQVRGETELGKQAKAFMDAGDLVPDELIMNIMKDETLGDEASKGWLLDGVPRTEKQVKALNEAGLVPEKVILLEVPDDVLIERCVGRLFDPDTGNTYHRTYFPPPADIAERCIQRSDDNEETMKNRIEQFKKNRQSLIDGYKDVLVQIDGNRGKDEIFQDICMALDKVTA